MRVLALGKFNALHRGHRQLVAEAALLGEPWLVRFEGMAAALAWQPRRPLLDEPERQVVLARWAAALGQALREWPLAFAEIRDWSPARFVGELAQRDMGGLVVGEDFRFGRDRSGDATTLAQLADQHGLAVRIVAPVCAEGAPISTTRIRAHLLAGEVAAAGALLGRPYRLSGCVVAGDGRGRQLGFPTANIDGIRTVLPAAGVYAALAQLADQRVPAAVNIGVLPTIAPERPLSVEAHLLDWSGDCYDQPLALDLIERLRPERSFSDLSALRRALAEDCRSCRKVLAEAVTIDASSRRALRDDPNDAGATEPG